MLEKNCQSFLQLKAVEINRKLSQFNMKYCSSFSVVFVLCVILPSFTCVNFILVERYNEILYNIDIKWMTIDLLQEVMSSTSCFVMILDEYYQHIVGSGINKTMVSKPYFKILVNESEDLLSPNYETVKVILQAKKNSCNLYLIFLANGEQVARFLTFGDRHRTMDSRAKFVLMKDRRMFYQKYNVLWKRIVNVLFVKQYRNTPRFELSTVPFPPPLNGPIIPYKISTWDRGFPKNKILFQDKTSNLKGQTLKVVTFEHMPTTALITARNSSQLEDQAPQYTGLEIEVLKTLSSAMNFHYAIYEPPNAEQEQWGRKQINGSFSGLLGEMCEGNADIALGNLYYTPYHLQMLDLSVPYNTECLTFLTPESLTDNSRQTLTLPFQGNMWIAVIITLFLGGFVFNFFALYHRYIENKDFNLMDSDSEISDTEEPNKLKSFLKSKWKLFRSKLRNQWRKLNKKNEFLKRNKAEFARKKLMMRYDWQRRLTRTFSSNDDDVIHVGLYIFERLDNSILYTYGMFMNVSLPKVPTGWTIRMFTGWWWLYCILVSVAYKASMTAILANPVPRVTIDTLEQLAESNIGCGGWGEQSKEFFVTSLDITSQKIGRKFEITYDIDSAVERVASGEFAYYENIHFLHYLTVKHKDENLLNRLNDTEDEKSIDKTKGKILHVMFNCVINMPVSVGLQKNSPLKPKIDSYLSRVVEAGLVIKWLNDVMFKIRATEAKQDKQEIKALMNLSKLYGAVVVLIAGYAVSIVILIWEVFMWYCVEKRSPDFDKYNLREYYAKKK